MKLADFKDLSDVELGLVNWLQDGNRNFYPASNTLPKIPSKEHSIRATLIRYLALGGCEECRPPETGLRILGAWINGDEKNSDFTNGLDFDGATLSGDLALGYCHIPDPLILRSAKVKNVFLSEATLGAGISAVRLRTDGDLVLHNATISDGVRLSFANISGNVDLSGTKIFASDWAFLCDGAQIRGSLFLREGASFSGAVSLAGSSIGIMSDEQSSWPKEILLSRCKYTAFLGHVTPTDAKSRLDWLSRIPCDEGEFWPDPYEQCAKVLREMGHSSDARTILIEKERLQRKARHKRLRMNGKAPIANLIGLGDWLLGITTRYGRQPLLAFVWLFAFWMFGALWFDQAAQRGEIKPNLPQMQVHPAWVQCAQDGQRRGDYLSQPDCFQAQPEGQSYPQFNALVYSADTLFPVVTLEVQSYWIPDDSKPFGMLARWYLWVHIIAGWALTLLAVAGFSGLIKTDSK